MAVQRGVNAGSPVAGVSPLPQPLQRRDLISLYAEAAHDTEEVTLPGGGKRHVDPPIKELMQDVNALPFVDSVAGSCAGGKRCTRMPDSGYYWGGYFIVGYRTDPASAALAAEFDRELRATRSVSKGVVGTVLPSGHGMPSEEAVKSPQEYALVFDSPPTLEALDNLWKAVHVAVGRHLKKT